MLRGGLSIVLCEICHENDLLMEGWRLMGVLGRLMWLRAAKDGLLCLFPEGVRVLKVGRQVPS